MNNGDIGYCACKQSCTENEGYCDYNYQCQDGHRCGSNNCPDLYGFGFNTDCCYIAMVGDEDFCTFEYPCEADEGDCDSNDECQIGLICDTSQDCSIFDKSYDVHCCQTGMYPGLGVHLYLYNIIPIYLIFY